MMKSLNKDMQLRKQRQRLGNGAKEIRRRMQIKVLT